MRVGSLFAGIGGFDLGLERAGFSTAWFCEQDAFCTAVLNQHWPGVPVYPDIRDLRAADIEPVDILCGGFPCQDLSVAGSGEGLDGARSGLWTEYARLIGELGPRYVIVENVAALLARGLGTVLGDLAALGYDAEWDCIPASAVGAPHRRDRIWLVAYPGSERQRAQPRGVYGDEAGDEGRPEEHDHVAGGPSQKRLSTDGRLAGREQGPAARASGEARARELADAEGEPIGAGLRACEPPEIGGRRLGYIGGQEDPWAVEPDVGRVAHGVPARVDRLRALGNALVPQIAEWIGCRIADYEAGR